MNFANVDAIIAKNNINRYFLTGQIDMVYLKSLSYDAAPEIEKLYVKVINSRDLKEKQMAQEIKIYFKKGSSDLKKEQSWQSYNIAKNKAGQIFDTLGK